MSDQVQVIQHDHIRFAQEPALAGDPGALTDLGKGDGLEDLCQMRDRIAPVGDVRRYVAPDQLLASAAGRDDPDPDLDQAHVGLHRRNHSGAAHRELCATAQDPLERRGHDGFRGEAEGHQQILQLLGGLVDRRDAARRNRLQKQADVGAEAIVLALVGDDQGSIAILAQQVKGGPGHVVGEDVQRVSLAMQLKTQHAVAQVEDAGRGIPLELARRAGHLLEDQAQGGALDGRKILSDRIPGADDGRAIALEEGRVAGGQHLVDPGRHRDVARAHLGGRPGHAQRVPGLEGTSLGVETPAHGIVDLDDAVGDLGHAPPRIGADGQGGADDELTAPVAGPMLENRPHARTQVIDVAHLAIQIKARLPGRGVFAGLEVEDPEFLLAGRLLDGLVEPGPAFVAERLCVDEFLERGGNPEQRTLFIINQRLILVAQHVGVHVQADQIGQAERRGLGQSDQRAGERVDFLDGVVVLNRGHHPGLANIHPDPIGDEARRVLAHHHAFAQDAPAKVLHKGDDRGVGVGRWNDFKQSEVARRVEEVGAQKVGSEIGRAALTDLMNGDARGV